MKLITTAFLSLLFVCANAQSYDSTKNCLSERVESYTGQTLLFLPKTPELKIYGYSELTTLSGSQSKYDSVVLARFVVESVQGKGSFRTFTLVQENDKKHLYKYYTQTASCEMMPDFIVEAHLEWLKKTYTETGLYLKCKEWDFGAFADAETGAAIDCQKHDVWTIKDVKTDSFVPSFLTENAKGEKLLFPIFAYHSSHFCISYESYQIAKAKGGDVLESVMNKKPKIEMTPDILALAIGEPLSKQKREDASQKSEIWVYYNMKIHIIGGKVAVINTDE
jgi:hypothetical protein